MSVRQSSVVRQINTQAEDRRHRTTPTVWSVDIRQARSYLGALMNQPHPKPIASNRSELLVAASITVVVVGLSFFLHWKWCGSDMQLSEALFVQGHEWGLSTYPFSIRPFLAYSIELLGRLFSLEVKTSFFVIQFSLAAAVGLSFYYFLRQLSFSIGWSRLGLFLVLSAYPILAAHIEPMHTRDDLWAHLFMILALLSLLKSRMTAGIVWYTLAIFARDQSLLFFGAFLLVAWLRCEKIPRRRLVLLSLLPLLIYGIFYAIVWQDPDPARFSLIQFNFENHLRTSDTLFSLFISFGFMWLAAPAAFRGGRSGSAFRLLWWGAILTVPATVFLTLFLTNARETRILFPPFVFMIPLTLLTLRAILCDLRGKMSLRLAACGLALFASLMAGGVWLGYAAFPDFEYRRCQDFQRLWAGIHFGLILSLIGYYVARAWQLRSPSTSGR